MTVIKDETIEIVEVLLIIASYRWKVLLTCCCVNNVLIPKLIKGRKAKGYSAL